MLSIFHLLRLEDSESTPTRTIEFLNCVGFDCVPTSLSGVGCPRASVERPLFRITVTPPSLGRGPAPDVPWPLAGPFAPVLFRPRTQAGRRRASTSLRATQRRRTREELVVWARREAATVHTASLRRGPRVEGSLQAGEVDLDGVPPRRPSGGAALAVAVSFVRAPARVRLPALLSTFLGPRHEAHRAPSEPRVTRGAEAST